MTKILEVACFKLESAIIAEEAGADRIEMCSNYEFGGVTPSEETILQIVSKIRIPVFVMIRPRAGNFNYTKFEIEAMIKSIQFCKDKNLKGLVFGCLTHENEIDMEACKSLIQEAGALQLTFHRAVDDCANIEMAIENIIQLGFHRVLTTGGKSNANEGKNALKHLQNKFGTRIKIMPGGGIRSNNLKQIMDVTHCSEFHSAAIKGNSEFCDEKEIKELKKILSSNE